MTEQELMEDYHRILTENEELQQKNTEDILSIISKKVDANYFKAIKEWLADEENGIWGDLKIVDKTIGEWQNETNQYEPEDYFNVLKGMYVNQSCGYCGDDYHGTLEIKINETEYLRASFSL